MAIPQGGFPQRPPYPRRIFCNRTLNLRSIRAVGYDMDYTLIHYQVDEWERCAFETLRQKLAERHWPVERLTFDPEAYQRGLIIDRQLGNILKANQFGYIKRAAHGAAMLDFDSLRQTYAQTIVDLSEPRFVFLNTLFSLSEAAMYAQLVDLLDAGAAPEVVGYSDLYEVVKAALDQAHVEGRLKAEILSDPDRFVERDPEMPQTLLDQRGAGKRVLLITNSEWTYVRDMMSYACDPYMPAGGTWKDLFDVIIVGARKPSFFITTQPSFALASDEGLLAPVVGTPPIGRVLLGGDAGTVERMLGLAGSQILYVGDHAYGDVHVSKNLRRWRTALVVRELEDDLRAQESYRPEQAQLTAFMDEKQAREFHQSQLKLQAQRARQAGDEETLLSLERDQEASRRELAILDQRITPLAQASGELNNPNWGLLMRSGNDKSYFARQVERHADIYTSRVSNFSFETPYAFFRSQVSPLPHEREEGSD